MQSSQYLQKHTRLSITKIPKTCLHELHDQNAELGGNFDAPLNYEMYLD
jgi:hypothetical protein